MSSSKSGLISKDPPVGKKKGKKIETNLAEVAGRANGSEIEPGAVLPLETLKEKL